MMPFLGDGSRLGAILLGSALLIGVGGVAGVWLSAGHYRPQLDQANKEAATCVAARDNLSELAAEQGKALGDLTLAAKERQAVAERAVDEAKARAKVDYVAANRLQQERSGGDQCAAATSIIDLELGL
ncbi:MULTISPECIES: hypothetical protein [Pseudomonas]|uniref:hypothetical protein n=1 Tax=Pseudomonas TaxID=286 RepID=UPI0013DFF8BE|nr:MULTISPECIES: hypothetical protein [Pseudomonas]MCE0912439.1 hypothetical protein [Pseudomonas kurunegalensis]QIG19304.1 hypothetical protein FY041_16935 [Pseudomonas monteilii]QIG24559.1 hypothetical protein FY043_16930 [Pseudomonas monteilii]WJR53996.1 hypothetical protein LU664_016670 [Pseudomonas kurunegalensis]WMM94628.1 hypothetical protein [Pseudomonas kurunegalensis]